MACLLIFSLPQQVVNADSDTDLKIKQIKVAYLANFIRFTTWPDIQSEDNKDKPLLITIIGDDNFSEMLQNAFSKSSINGHKITIQSIKKLSIKNDGIIDKQRQQISNSQMIYMRSTNHADLQAVRRLNTNPGHLLLGDMKDFAESGGMIGFRDSRHGVSFTVNIAEVRRARIQVSSKVLRLGVIVYQKDDR